MSDERPARRRRVERGEGEVTSWPRGLVGYVSKGPEDATPSDEEDRTANRLRLAARLLAVRRAAGASVEAEIARLATAERAFAAGDRASAAALVDRLLAEIDPGPAAPTR